MTTAASPRRTAIVATLGPVSETRRCIEGLVLAGMDMVRLSMSNGSRERHLRTARLVREVAAEHGRGVGLLADLQGRKNRLGALPGGSAQWRTGDTVVLSSGPGRSTPYSTWLTHGWNPARVRPGGEILIDDGVVVLAITRATDTELHCAVVEGGGVTDGRGVTLPGGTVFPPGLTERDADDLRFARGLGVESVALSFAYAAEDFDAVRALAPEPLVIGKVEHPAAVAALPSLAGAFDGLMVARGDLALEVPFEDVPFVQRRTIAECNGRGKLSMVATQLLHSMRESTLPTRAEVSDIAHAVSDGAGALVLTGETSYGRHPVRAVEVLRRVIERAESHAAEHTPDLGLPAWSGR
ncbi:pyruvate kinase [Streptomyces sp. NPDC005408]|uniref:pyruvate kinase n=1 Tax=Streptomyces sp. NPDC005408 TaxID=3155341 RepID=UPI0033AFAFBB